MEASRLSASLARSVQGIEVRHLRYFVAVADAGTFTHAAARVFVAQPTLSQQIRRLEEMVGAPLLQRRRDGVRLTPAGTVLLEESRHMLSQLDHGIRRARLAAGLGRPRLRVVLPPDLPEALVVGTASQLQRTASAADVGVEWLETQCDAEFSLIRQHRADAALGWLPSKQGALPDPLDLMHLGEFEPFIWVQSSNEVAGRRSVSLGELARMDVIHGPRRASAGIYDAWLGVLRTKDPRFGFLDPSFRHSLPATLAFASTANRPTAVLTGPLRARSDPFGPDLPAETYDMAPVCLDDRTLTATAALAWSGDLPRQLQQILFDAAVAIDPHDRTEPLRELARPA